MAPRAAEIDRSEAYPWDHVERLRALGMLGMTIPKELGGAGLGYLEAALVIGGNGQTLRRLGPHRR